MSCVSAVLVCILLNCTIFLLNSTSADVANDFAITVLESCNMANNLDTAHAATINPGQTVEGIGTTTFTVFCNDSSGYSIYAIGYSNNEYGNTNLLASNSSNPSIATGLATSGNTSAWAMKLIPVTAASSGTTQPYTPTIENNYDDYNVVPSTYVKVATFASSTDSTIGSSLKTTYRAHISGLQTTDIYTGKVRYALVHPANADTPPADKPIETNPGKICYYSNGVNVVGTMGCQSASDGDSAKLFASNFSREDYGFAGWSDAFDYATNPNANFYGPNEDIVVPTGTTDNGLNLYAVWVKSAGTMQGWSGCGSMQSATYNNKGDADESTWSITASLNNITALTDTRDGDTYAIAKLTDGRCWMIENLRLADKDSNNNDIILSSANTNNPFLPLTNIYDSGTTSNHLSPTSSVAYDADTAPEGWCEVYNSAACLDQSRIRTDNTSNRETYTANTNMSHDANLYSYGNYYNWYSATAGRGRYASSYGETASGDLCPIGWHLPTGTGSGEFGLLSNSLGGYKDASNVAQTMSDYTSPTLTIMLQRFRHFPINLLYSGYTTGVSFSCRGNCGNYWASTVQRNIYAHALRFYSYSVSPGNTQGFKYEGLTVRCVANSQ